MTPQGRNRSSFQIVIKLQNSHFPQGRSISTRRKIGNGSAAAKSSGDCAIAGVQLKDTEMEEKRKTLSARLARWTAELALVFIGVYAAFWLNGYQQHQQEAKRRDQILASIERTLRAGLESGKINTAQEEGQSAEFRSALDAGKMPPLHPFVFTTDYNPCDFATLLQAGGIELLDVETLTALRNDESVIRWGLSRMAHYQ